MARSHKLVLVITWMALSSVSAVGISACSWNDNSDKTNIASIYENEHRLMGENYTHPAIEKRRELCLDPDIDNTDIEHFDLKILRLKLRLTDTQIDKRGWIAKRETKLRTEYLENAQSVLFWEMDRQIVGHYSHGAEAVNATLRLCLVSMTEPRVNTFSIHTKPPSHIGVPASENNAVNETYEYAGRWLRWKLLGETEPPENQRISVRIWRPCQKKIHDSYTQESRERCVARWRNHYLGEVTDIPKESGTPSISEEEMRKKLEEKFGKAFSPVDPD